MEEEQAENIEILLNEKLANLPVSPGIYQFKNQAGKIIYIGKAKQLRNRVRSYFQHSKPADAKTKALVKKIADIEIIVVDSEAEALILEDTLIKKYKPKYNVLLRDDKTFPYIKITNEDYPRVFSTRKIMKDGSKYIGPFTEARTMKYLLRTLRTIFQFRTCKLNITDEAIKRKKFKLCLDYHIKKCEGPCEGLISQEDYQSNIKQAIQVFSGKTRDLERMLETKMFMLSEELRFEDAAIVRNRLGMLRDFTSKQKIVSRDMLDRDIFGFARIDDTACSLVFKIRDGRLIGKRHYIVTGAAELPEDEILRRTIERWYLESEFIPAEIYLPFEPEQFEYLLDWLNETKGKTLHIFIPKIGDKRKLVEMAITNAEFIIKEYISAIDKREQAVPRPLMSLQRDLRLSELPRRIECFDNSHIQGSELVSSLVVFIDGKPSKANYRKFKIKTVDKNDDFAAMQESVKRRYTRQLEESQPLPDLIVIDGGKGQLSHAFQVLKDLNIDEKIRIIGIAKRLEEIFFPENPEPLLLPKTSSSLRLIQQIRDEAHRFAITFHRQLRDKRTLKTELTEIPGIGEHTAQKLLIGLGSVENIKSAPIEKLSEFTNMKAAAAVRSYFDRFTEVD